VGKCKGLLASAETEKLDQVENESGLTLTYYGKKIDSPEELVASAKIDLNLWDIVEVRVNQYGVAGKANKGQDETGRWKGTELWYVPLRQITVKLKRKAPKFIQDGIKGLLKDFRPIKLGKPSHKKHKSPFMLEVSLFDAHFGKLAWGLETGQDYDLKIAESDYCAAIDDLLDRASGFPIEKVLFPIGSDFFHVDNWLGTTTKGTLVDSTDDRKTKVFKAGVKAVEYAFRRCREVAPVEGLWIGGNHDMQTSWHLAYVLGRIFEGDKFITIDDGPKQRKYRAYGPALIGFSHGDQGKRSDLPLIMATEAPDLWSAAKHRHWHTGHFHKKAKFSYTAGDTHNGVEVWILPSLSATDAWHYQKGFVGCVRAAEAYLWSKTEGYAGHFSVNARSG
jgi:hypothetical protein